jgi:DNA polymerase lambda
MAHSIRRTRDAHKRRMFRKYKLLSEQDDSYSASEESASNSGTAPKTKAKAKAAAQKRKSAALIDLCDGNGDTQHANTVTSSNMTAPLSPPRAYNSPPRRKRVCSQSNRSAIIDVADATSSSHSSSLLGRPLNGYMLTLVGNILEKFALRVIELGGAVMPVIPQSLTHTLLQAQDCKRTRTPPHIIVLQGQPATFGDLHQLAHISVPSMLPSSSRPSTATAVTDSKDTTLRHSLTYMCELERRHCIQVVDEQWLHYVIEHKSLPPSQLFHISLQTVLEQINDDDTTSLGHDTPLLSAVSSSFSAAVCASDFTDTPTSASASSSSAAAANPQHSQQKDHAASDLHRFRGEYNPAVHLPEGVKLSPKPWMASSRFKSSLACQKSSSTITHFNQHLTQPLQLMMDIHNALGNSWNKYGYQKVIAILKSRDYEVTLDNYESLGSIRGVGPKLLEHIYDILRTGTFEKLHNLLANPKVKGIQELANVWGIGYKTAITMYNQGIRSVADLRRRVLTAPTLLNDRQLIGLRYFEDILKRIPRREVQAIEGIVRYYANKLCPGVAVICCGSYRRGAPSSGDCDLLISHPDAAYGSSLLNRLIDPAHFLRPLIAKLDAVGFLTAHLSNPRDRSPHDHPSYMGVCRVPAKFQTHYKSRSLDSKYHHQEEPLAEHETSVPTDQEAVSDLHRRIDIKVYPPQAIGFAMLYFTGCDHFNRSMRFYAKKNGWTLSDRGLCKAVRIRNERIAQSKSVYCPTERSVFEAMQLDYIPPRERNVYKNFGATSGSESHSTAAAAANEEIDSYVSKEYN